MTSNESGKYEYERERERNFLEDVEATAESGSAAHSTSTTLVPDDPPPYDAHADAPPPVAISQDFLSMTAEQYTMKGHYTSPDFEIVRSDGMRVLQTATHSNTTFHETFITDNMKGGNLFTVRRSMTPSNGRLYYADTPGRNGKRIFEIEMGPNLLSGGSSRLVFRNVLTGRLDTLHFNVKPGGKSNEIVYQDHVLGDISSASKRTPEFMLNMHVPAVDPLLFLIIALAIDDQTMTKRRRLRSHPMRGAKGITGSIAVHWWVLTTAI